MLSKTISSSGRTVISSSRQSRLKLHAYNAYPASSPTGLMSLNRVAKEKVLHYYDEALSLMKVMPDVVVMAAHAG